jgi:hypothetical protein
MKGGPIDMTPFGSVLSGIGALYWLVVLAALGLVLWKCKGWVARVIGCSLVLAVLVVPVVWRVVDLSQKQAAFKARLDVAMARFEMRCKSAGEKTTRTVENVDGVVWLKWRTEGRNHDDQFKLDDPYGNDCTGESCVVRLLRATKGLELDPKKELHHHTGYRFVESRDPKDGVLYRYTLRLTGPDPTDPRWAPHRIDPELDKEVISQTTARYAITWDDISTREDRESWIAGSSLKVIDQQTNEIVAERIGFMVDQGQGNKAGFRSPWGFAEYTACPAFDQGASRTPNLTSKSRDFIRKAIQSTQGS